VQVTGGGTGTGIAALINGGTDICAASRPLKQKEREQAQKRRGKEVKELAVALDGVVIFFNEDNPLTELSLEQLESIYRGQITDWSALGRASGKIICYGRENSSGTYMYFKEHVLNGKDFATDVQSLPGTAAVINAVLKDKNAIGYGGIGYVKGVKTVPISAKAGVQSELPTLENVVKGSYPLSRQLYFYMLGEPTDELKDFLAWALCDEGQKVCETVGYYPVPKTHE
jgi:phosphate transport system substrate-binding protein